jgi:hypothetical protein
VDLRVTGVREQRTALRGAPRSRDVARLGVGREEEHVPVPASCEHDGVRGVRAHHSGDQVARDDADGMPVLHDEVEHLGPVVHRHRTGRDLVQQRLVRTEQELLTGLATRVERARDLRATERAVVE